MTLAMGAEAVLAALMGTYLKQLKLPAIAKHCAQVAREARLAGKSHEEFLLALLEAEIAQREVSRQKLRLDQARFPVLKTLDTFQFAEVPSLNKAEVLELARGSYIADKENLLLLGGSGHRQDSPGHGPWSSGLPAGKEGALRRGHRVGEPAAGCQ